MHKILFNPPLEDNYLGHQIKEIYFDKVYEPYLKGKSGLIILDVGANIGMTSYYFSQFADKVYSLEPSIEHFAIFAEMLKENEIKNVIPINKALYIKVGKYPFFHNKNKTMYSLHQAVSDGSENEMVETTTLTKLFEEYKIDHIDLFKLDVEGSEAEIIGGSDFKKYADKINTILLERHQWSGREPNQLVDTLRMRGFNVTKAEAQADLLVATK